MREAREQAALREVELERPAQVELLVERADELERLPAHVHTRPDRPPKAWAQRERMLGEAVGQLLRILLRAVFV